MTPKSASSASSARFPDMHGSPAATSSSLGPGTAASHAVLWAHSDADAFAGPLDHALPETPKKALPPLGADISTMATAHSLLDESLSTPHPPRSVYPDPNGPIEHATPRAPLPVLEMSFDGYAQTHWNLGLAGDVERGPSPHSSPRHSVFFDARSSVGDMHALRHPSQLL